MTAPRQFPLINTVDKLNMETLFLSERKIVVGVDFGTTFSAIAWGNTHDVRPILQHDQSYSSSLLTHYKYQGFENVIQKWPGMSSPLDKSSEKVPTQILYSNEVPEGFKWGYQIRDDVPRHQWFKLYVTAHFPVQCD
jgi:hypothetical protein